MKSPLQVYMDDVDKLIRKAEEYLSDNPPSDIPATPLLLLAIAKMMLISLKDKKL